MATERKRAFIEGLEAQLRQTVAATRQAEVSAGSATAFESSRRPSATINRWVFDNGGWWGTRSSTGSAL